MPQIIDITVAVPTYFPGRIIENLFNSLPKVKEVLVLDNSSDQNLKNLINKKYDFIKYIETGDIGLGRTFNFLLNKARCENIFITQPDVELEKNCLENLVLAKKKYKNAAILSPLVFEENKYCFYDAPLLKINKKNLVVQRKNFKSIEIIPEGDICVEALTSTAFLIDKKKILSVGGWDNFYYTYLEDIDLSMRLRINKLEMIKISKAKVYHKPFSSHEKKIHDNINKKRIINFMKSSIYFKLKFSSRKDFIYYFFKIFLKTVLQLVYNIIIFNLTKAKKNFYKLVGFANFLKSLN